MVHHLGDIHSNTSGAVILHPSQYDPLMALLASIDASLKTLVACLPASDPDALPRETPQPPPPTTGLEIPPGTIAPQDPVTS